VSDYSTLLSTGTTITDIFLNIFVQREAKEFSSERSLLVNNN